MIRPSLMNPTSTASATMTTSTASPRRNRFGMEVSPVPMDVAAVTSFFFVSSSSRGMSSRYAAVKAPEVMTRMSSVIVFMVVLMSPSGNGRKSLAFRRSLEVKRPCADISDDESHEIRSEVPLGMDYQIPPGGAEWGGGDAGARTGARDL